MKVDVKRLLIGGSILSLSAIVLGACGNSNDDAASSNGSAAESSAKVEGDIKLWVDTEHIDALQGQVDKFEKEYPDVKVTVAVGSSADAKADVSKDPEQAADVFMMPHDQVGQMAEAGLIYPIGDKQAATIKDTNVEAADDVKTWEGLTSAGKIGTNFAEDGANYIFGPLFMSNGNVLYGEDGEDINGTNFNNEAGVEVLQWIADQKNNSGVLQASESALSDLQSGKSDAFLSGPWSKNDVEKALGDNMGVAAYPTIDFGSGAKQMKAFLGVKLYAVNQQTEAPLAAMALAEYLSNQETQEIEFTENGVVPSNKDAQESDAVKADAVAKAVMEMSDAEHSVVMPKLPEMVSFWPPMDALINDTYKGQIKPDQFQDKLDKFVSDISKVTE
ncbi:extracellular solute-binding protein [Enterococcus gallinarum]|uniref:extracellular solute-binding protein n=1 Tax=Enterococcus gallinarum TaxID=1353 RepID=UPI001D080438|nr:extracellular solute-binding protein [Enterococcus gallinarum]MCB7448290.1 extracellular solute-binding protein [Enterococcus gallinarum]